MISAPIMSLSPYWIYERLVLAKVMKYRFVWGNSSFNDIATLVKL